MKLKRIAAVALALVVMGGFAASAKYYGRYRVSTISTPAYIRDINWRPIKTRAKKGGIVQVWGFKRSPMGGKFACCTYKGKAGYIYAPLLTRVGY